MLDYANISVKLTYAYDYLQLWYRKAEIVSKRDENLKYNENV